MDPSPSSSELPTPESSERSVNGGGRGRGGASGRKLCVYKQRPTVAAAVGEKGFALRGSIEGGNAADRPPAAAATRFILRIGSSGCNGQDSSLHSWACCTSIHLLVIEKVV